MKALRLYGPNDLRLSEESEPIPKSGESLIRVTAVGLCGSDIHWYEEAGIGDAALSKPLVLGHEFAGVIIGGERDGTRVAIDPAVPCGKCDRCIEGNPNLCTHLQFAGHNKTDGALRELMTWPDHLLFQLPDSISDEEGAMLELLGVAIHALDLSKIRIGMSVGVYGCGPIGMLIIQLAKLMGASQILATERLDHRIDAARRYGASQVFQVNGGQEHLDVLAASRGNGVDVAFEAAGENEAVEVAIETVRPGGRVILIGIPPDDRTSFQASSARRKGLTIKLCRRMKHTYPRAIQLVSNGMVDVSSLISHRFSLDEYEEAFKVAGNRAGLKVIICPT